MTDSSLVDGLRAVDTFYKNVILMCEDLLALIREKTLLSPIKLMTDINPMWLNKEKRSEHKRVFIFEWNGYRFLQVLVKVDENKLRRDSSYYKGVCATLGVDPSFPLLVAWGILRPRASLQRFTDDGWTRVRWADNSVLLDLPEQFKLAEPASYAWNTQIELIGPPNIDQAYCENGTVKLRKISEIRDTGDVEMIIEDLLKMDNRVAGIGEI